MQDSIDLTVEILLLSSQQLYQYRSMAERTHKDKWSLFDHRRLNDKYPPQPLKTQQNAQDVSMTELQIIDKFYYASMCQVYKESDKTIPPPETILRMIKQNKQKIKLLEEQRVRQLSKSVSSPHSMRKSQNLHQIYCSTSLTKQSGQDQTKQLYEDKKKSIGLINNFLENQYLQKERIHWLMDKKVSELVKYLIDKCQKIIRQGEQKGKKQSRTAIERQKYIWMMKNQEISNTNEKLGERLQKAKETIQLKQKQIQKLLNEIQDLHKQVSKSHLTISQNLDTIQKMTNRFNELHQRVQQLEDCSDRIKPLQAQIKRKTTKINFLQEQLDRLQKTDFQKMQKYQELSEAYLSLQQNIMWLSKTHQTISTDNISHKTIESQARIAQDQQINPPDWEQMIQQVTTLRANILNREKIHQNKLKQVETSIRQKNQIVLEQIIVEWKNKLNKIVDSYEKQIDELKSQLNIIQTKNCHANQQKNVALCIDSLPSFCKE